MQFNNFVTLLHETILYLFFKTVITAPSRSCLGVSETPRAGWSVNLLTGTHKKVEIEQLNLESINMLKKWLEVIHCTGHY